MSQFENANNVCEAAKETVNNGTEICTLIKSNNNNTDDICKINLDNKKELDELSNIYELAKNSEDNIYIHYTSNHNQKYCTPTMKTSECIITGNIQKAINLTREWRKIVRYTGPIVFSVYQLISFAATKTIEGIDYPNGFIRESLLQYLSKNGVEFS